MGHNVLTASPTWTTNSSPVACPPDAHTVKLTRTRKINNNKAAFHPWAWHLTIPQEELPPKCSEELWPRQTAEKEANKNLNPPLACTLTTDLQAPLRKTKNKAKPPRTACLNRIPPASVISSRQTLSKTEKM